MIRIMVFTEANQLQFFCVSLLRDDVQCLVVLTHLGDSRLSQEKDMKGAGTLKGCPTVVVSNVIRRHILLVSSRY